MNEHYKKAELDVKDVVDRLKRILSQHGEDISCYSPGALDEPIRLLIQARGHMAVAEQQVKQESQ